MMIIHEVKTRFTEAISEKHEKYHPALDTAVDAIIVKLQHGRDAATMMRFADELEVLTEEIRHRFEDRRIA